MTGPEKSPPVLAIGVSAVESSKKPRSVAVLKAFVANVVLLCVGKDAF